MGHENIGGTIQSKRQSKRQRCRHRKRTAVSGNIIEQIQNIPVSHDHDMLHDDHDDDEDVCSDPCAPPSAKPEEVPIPMPGLASEIVSVSTAPHQLSRMSPSAMSVVTRGEPDLISPSSTAPGSKATDLSPLCGVGVTARPQEAVENGKGGIVVAPGLAEKSIDRTKLSPIFGQKFFDNSLGST